jgi:membrane protein required for colicin V production
MNALDMILAIPLLWFAWKGFSRGFISEVASLAALIAGAWLASQFSWFVGDHLGKLFNIESKYISLVSFAITFAAVVLLMNLAGKLATKLAKLAALGLPNRLAGALFGFLKTAFILSVVIFFYQKLDPKTALIPNDLRKESLIWEPITGMAPVLLPKLVGGEGRLKSLTLQSKPPSLPVYIGRDLSGLLSESDAQAKLQYRHPKSSIFKADCLLSGFAKQLSIGWVGNSIVGIVAKGFRNSNPHETQFRTYIKGIAHFDANFS